MGDSNDKMPRRPALAPSANQTAVARRPFMPTVAAPVAKPRRPMMASDPPAPRRPTMEPEARERHASRPIPTSALVARHEPPIRSDSTSRPRVRKDRVVASSHRGTRVGSGSFDCLRGMNVLSYEDRALQTGYVRVSAGKEDGFVTGIIDFAHEGRRLLYGTVSSFVPGPRPTNAEIQKIRKERGFRYARETVDLGDPHGRRIVAHCESAGHLGSSEIQASVPVITFMSPEIPAWRSHAPATVDPGPMGRMLPGEGREVLETIFSGPTGDLVEALLRKRRPAYSALHGVTDETADAFWGCLRDEIVIEEWEKTLQRIRIAYAMGEPTFARLWNLAISLSKAPPASAIESERDDEADSIQADPFAIGQGIVPTA